MDDNYFKDNDFFWGVVIPCRGEFRLSVREFSRDVVKSFIMQSIFENSGKAIAYNNSLYPCIFIENRDFKFNFFKERDDAYHFMDDLSGSTSGAIFDMTPIATQMQECQTFNIDNTIGRQE